MHCLQKCINDLALEIANDTVAKVTNLFGFATEEFMNSKAHNRDKFPLSIMTKRNTLADTFGTNLGLNFYLLRQYFVSIVAKVRHL